MDWLEALRLAIDQGNAAYARGEFKSYAAPGDFAADLKAKLHMDLNDIGMPS